MWQTILEALCEQKTLALWQWVLMSAAVGAVTCPIGYWLSKVIVDR